MLDQRKSNSGKNQIKHLNTVFKWSCSLIIVMCKTLSLKLFVVNSLQGINTSLSTGRSGARLRQQCGVTTVMKETRKMSLIYSVLISLSVPLTIMCRFSLKKYYFENNVICTKMNVFCVYCDVVAACRHNSHGPGKEPWGTPQKHLGAQCNFFTGL